MLPFEDRYSRQRRLQEVGPAGQRAIEQATVGVAEYPGREAEIEYLRRAGATVHPDAATESLAFPHADIFSHDQSRNFAWGAWSALRQLRTVLKHAATAAPFERVSRDT